MNFCRGMVGHLGGCGVINLQVSKELANAVPCEAFMLSINIKPHSCLTEPDVPSRLILFYAGCQ